jgi:DNA replication ATP-dependent helicase Dna2
VCILIQLHQNSADRAKPFTILITSATNSAIETCLEAVCDRMRHINLNTTVAKVGLGDETEKQWMRQKGATLLKQEKVTMKYLLEQKQCVIGSTAWRLKRCGFGKEKNVKPFDVILFDEGSQVTVANSSLALHYMNPHGRLIIAGDHKQVQLKLIVMVTSSTVVATLFTH